MSQPCCDDKLLKYPLKSILTFCQSDTQKVYSEQILNYDLGRKLINSTTYSLHSKPQFVNYNYNKDGYLMSKEFFTEDEPDYRMRIFEYDGQYRLAYDGFNDDGGNNPQNTYYYDQGGKLLSHITNCNGNKAEYTFNYDNQGRMIKKYRNNILQSTYQYEQYGLSKEINYYLNKPSEIKYEYDYFGQLSTIVKDGKIIEKNIYNNGRLIKKWINYYGIDPCYSSCCSQYVIVYEYY